MKCDSKMMLKIAVGLGVALAVAYFTLPAAQALILASAPILVALICPVAMLLMMKTMNGGSKDEGTTPGQTASRKCTDG
ncbi:MAG: hypothetical protein A3E79_13755 [Burkholderiales bacterium RIFCSPHIGHO2_12_FULL_61_11]|nr:MAG: hypothetical protein A3E79_13755 [Burkholderiales bacterium RIFCSPHIGHO2_12_FULL_61_11]